MQQSDATIRTMLRQPARCCMLLMALLLLSQMAWAEPVYSKSRRFRIPFQFDAAELKRLGTREIQLFVSRDGGEHWQLVEGVSPETGKFTFEAPEDGDYQFSVKTVAASGLLYPAGPHQTGLRVMVDGTPPQLDLQLVEIEPGRVKLSWSSQDDNLDVSTLKLEFRESGSDVWNVVAVRTHAYGQTTWTASPGSSIQVRGEVADMTGNQTQSTATCELAAPVPRDDRPDFGQPVANDSMSLPASSAEPPSRPAGITPRLTSSSAIGEALPVKGATAESSVVPQNQEVQRLAHNGIHKVNSDTFRIGYSLDGIGPSGVKQVDLYITEDNGRKWYYYGQDADRTSPMEVTVPRDGEYGLAFRVTNGLGRVDIPPQPNDPPEVRITVDRSPPVVKLMPLESGQPPGLNQVVISWTAQDEDLAERPAALYYSAAATGPWEPIQSWQPNSGRFVWNVPAKMDQPFYVRLDVRDNAGNVTRAYSEQPFLVDRAQPRARITEVEPLTNPPR